MPSLDGKLAVVTGGTKGLGLSITRALADSGAVVIAASRTPDPSITDHGDIHPAKVDITDPLSVDKLMRTTSRNYAPPDIVVANAGVSRNGTIQNLSDADWLDTITTNLTGAFYTFRAAVPLMRDNGGGKIVAISSVMATHPARGTGAYAASKAGLTALVAATALETARHGIQVNTISPGILDTGLGDALTTNPDLWESYQAHIASRRVGRAQEIANAVLFLAGPDSAYVTGANLAVHGGISVWT